VSIDLINMREGDRATQRSPMLFEDMRECVVVEVFLEVYCPHLVWNMLYDLILNPRGHL